MQRYRKPLSADIAEELQKAIQEGTYAPGSQLPAEVDFAKELGVSRATLREAFSILHRQGYIARKHGVGSFVAERGNQILSSFEKLESMMALVRRSGYEPTMHVLESRPCTLDKDYCTEMDLPDDSAGLHFRTLYSANGFPFVYTVEFCPAAILPATIHAQRGACEDLADFISRNAAEPPVATLTKLKGILPTEELSKILMIDAGSPIIRQHFTLFDRSDRVVGCGYDYFNSSWFEFSVYTHTTRL